MDCEEGNVKSGHKTTSGVQYSLSLNALHRNLEKLSPFLDTRTRIIIFGILVNVVCIFQEYELLKLLLHLTALIQGRTSYNERKEIRTITQTFAKFIICL